MIDNSTHPDEPSIQKLKQMWTSYGVPLLIGIVITLLLVSGYYWWKNARLKSAQQASFLYQQVRSLTEPDATRQAQNTSLDGLVRKLQKEHPDSIYAAFASFLQAGHLLANDHANKANGELNWVLQHHPNDALGALARLRLARVLVWNSLDSAQSALTLLQHPGPFNTSYALAKGDIYWALGQNSRARQAYLKAARFAVLEGQQTPLLNLKLDDLTPPTKSAPLLPEEKNHA